MTESTELVSVIIPCFNGQVYLAETLDSVLTQSYLYWEALIINDGSTDNTEQIALEYQAKDKRFIYIYQKNKGISSTRKTGIDRAKGKYIQFLDADDILLPERLNQMVGYYKQLADNVIIYSDFVIGSDISVRTITRRPSIPVSLNRNIRFIDLYMDWTERIIFVPSCLLFRKDDFAKIIYDESYRWAEDFDLYLNLMSAGFEFKFIDKVNVIYRDNPSGLSKNRYFVNKSVISVLLKWKQTDKRCNNIFRKRLSGIIAKDFLHSVVKQKRINNYLTDLNLGLFEKLIIRIQAFSLFLFLLFTIVNKKRHKDLVG